MIFESSTESSSSFYEEEGDDGGGGDSGSSGSRNEETIIVSSGEEWSDVDNEEDNDDAFFVENFRITVPSDGELSSDARLAMELQQRELSNALRDYWNASHSESEEEDEEDEGEEEEEMSYEEMLELQERMGEVKKKSLSSHSINSLKRTEWFNNPSKNCVVCIIDFKDGDTIITLDCQHSFHECCLVSWLKIHASCPVCRTKLQEIIN